MTKKVLEISYLEFNSIDELSPEDKSLALAACEAIKGSYAPYSHFNVGAAVRLSDGAIVTGANQENAAYPSGLCAERTAMFYANAHYPDKAMTEIAIAASQDGVLCADPATPCGNCRQVMAEYQTKSGTPMAVLLVGAKKVLKFSNVESVLPFIFDSLDAK